MKPAPHSLVDFSPHQPVARGRARSGLALLSLLGLLACGGSLDNPESVPNPVAATGQKLSFAYFQRCVNPVLNEPITLTQNGVTSTNTCSSAGCHSSASGTGGAFRLKALATVQNIATQTPEQIRASDMYQNFLSAQAEVVIPNPSASRLINKPLVRGVLHGGGVIFSSDQTAQVRLMLYWMSRPMPAGQDEFSAAGESLFTPNNSQTGACNLP